MISYPVLLLTAQRLDKLTYAQMDDPHFTHYLTA